MRAVKVLSVCGSGTVSSAMLSSKLADLLEENGYRLESTEVSPSGVRMAIANSHYDLIAYTSPVDGDYDVPVLNATGFLVGINEDEFVDELFKVIKKLKL